jgi:hypothetical protein
MCRRSVSFIALAAWVRREAFRLLNSNVLTECLQVNVAKPKPCIILIM